MEEALQFHELTPEEKRLVRELLSQDFPGRDALLGQMSEASGRWIESRGAPAFLFRVPPEAEPAEVTQRTPVEAERIAKDADGAQIHVVLHVVEGHLKELEFFREDGEAVERRPTSDDLQPAYPPQPE